MTWKTAAGAALALAVLASGPALAQNDQPAGRMQGELPKYTGALAPGLTALNFRVVNYDGYGVLPDGYYPFGATGFGYLGSVTVKGGAMRFFQSPGERLYARGNLGLQLGFVTSPFVEGAVGYRYWFNDEIFGSVEGGAFIGQFGCAVCNSVWPVITGAIGMRF